MYYDLEVLIEFFKSKLDELPVNKEGKHIAEMEDVIGYLQYLVDDDYYF